MGEFATHRETQRYTEKNWRKEYLFGFKKHWGDFIIRTYILFINLNMVIYFLLFDQKGQNYVSIIKKIRNISIF